MFVAMEAVTGGDLRALVYEALSDREYTDADVLRWALDIAKALNYLVRRPRTAAACSTVDLAAAGATPG